MHDSNRRRCLLAALGTGLAASLPCLPSLAAGAAPPAAPALLQARVWSGALDPAGYLVSEKFDGVRALWQGGALRFRSGRLVPAPAWFTARLPREPLDGELWLGRGRFDELSGRVRTDVPDDTAWRALRYQVFELPGAPGPFTERARRLGEIVRAAAWPQLAAVPQEAVADHAALQQRLAATLAHGGEGLMLHRADAPYETGRSDALFKLKPSLDAEATVVSHHPGRGRHQGVLGALGVRTPDGRGFLIGTGFTDAARRAPPPIGAQVTYRYRDLTSTGLPRFASFVRLHDGL